MKKLNNTILAAIFGGLVLVFILVRTFRSPATERNFKTDIVNIDTSKVSEINIYSPKSAELLKLQRSGEDWMVIQGSVQAKAVKNTITGVLSNLMSIKPQRLASAREANWEQFNVTDSAGIRVVVKEAGKESLDLIVGKTTYKQAQPSPQQQQMGGQPNIVGETYVRLNGEKETYVTAGFLEMLLSQPADSYRSKTLVKASTKDITRLAFNYPADSSFTLQKLDTIWQINEQRADQGRVDQYLNRLTSVSGSSFSNDASPGSNPDFQLAIEGNNQLQIFVRAWQSGSNYIINSSINPDSYFTSAKDGIFSQLFVGTSYFYD